jgi:hypothetical protein
MIDPHVHCAECFREIPTTLKQAGGKTKDLQIHRGIQVAMVPTPEGLAPKPRPVPLCPTCAEVINKQAKAAASKILVPGQHGVPGGRSL